jgi:hypothetical protein
MPNGPATATRFNNPKGCSSPYDRLATLMLSTGMICHEVGSKTIWILANEKLNLFELLVRHASALECLLDSLIESSSKGFMLCFTPAVSTAVLGFVDAGG